MLTDIFADRYSSRPIWTSFGDSESKLLTQCFRMVSEQLFPYYLDGKESAATKPKWASIHDRLSMELGVHELSPRAYSIQTQWNGMPWTQSGMWTLDHVCKEFVCAPYDRKVSADRFMKERISFVELAFRQREEDLAGINASLPRRLIDAQLVDARARLPGQLPGNRGEGVKSFNAILNVQFSTQVDELNERLRRANTPLNYHNGFIQVVGDPLIQKVIESPFWALVKDPMWKNVDIDMKEAIDRRDSGDRDPAFYAARALESAIKIISDTKGWTHGGEKGAHNYIDNLGSKKNGSFIASWEAEMLKEFFTQVRNPFGHGPGSDEMPKLTQQQASCAIETCMSWIRSLVERM
jgi:hypothetical protein